MGVYYRETHKHLICPSDMMIHSPRMFSSQKPLTFYFPKKKFSPLSPLRQESKRQYVIFPLVLYNLISPWCLTIIPLDSLRWKVCPITEAAVRRLHDGGEIVHDFLYAVRRDKTRVPDGSN